MNNNNKNTKQKLDLPKQELDLPKKKLGLPIKKGVNKSHHKPDLPDLNMEFKNTAGNCGEFEISLPKKELLAVGTYKLQMFDNYGDGWQTNVPGDNVSVADGLKVTKTYNDGTVEEEEYAMCSLYNPNTFACTPGTNYAEQIFTVNSGIIDITMNFPGDYYGEIGLIVRGPDDEVLFSSGTVDGNSGIYSDLNPDGFGTMVAGPIVIDTPIIPGEFVCVCSQGFTDCDGNCSDKPCEVKQNKDLRNLFRNSILGLPLIPLGFGIAKFLKKRREAKRIEEENTHTHNSGQHEEINHSHPHESDHHE